MQRKLIKHSDPGHGWPLVAHADLDLLGVADQISGCSYEANGRVYLEEDRDAWIFLRAARAAGWAVVVQGHSEGGGSFVRNLLVYRSHRRLCRKGKVAYAPDHVSLA